MANTRNSTKKEALRKKSLGELGELFSIKVLVDNLFEKIENLNDTKMNYPFADLYAEKGKEKYIITVKTRNKYQTNGELNSFYNIGAKAYKYAKIAEKERVAKAYWMAIQFDNKTNKHYSIYFGTLEELNGKNAIPIKDCQERLIGKVLVDNKRHYFDFDFYNNRK